MSWKDEMRQASFRGVKFYVSVSTTSIGRKVKLHEYPNRDKPYPQDLGKAADRFQIEAYVIQNNDNDFNYMKDRDKLIKAIKKKGPGKLVHPYYGEIEVSVLGQASINETYNEGGIARFSIPFVQAGDKDIADIAPDYPSLMDSLVALAQSLGIDNAGAILDSVMTAANIAGDVVATLNKIQQVVNSIRGGIAAVTAAVTGYITNVLATLNSIIDAPCDIAQGILSSAQQLENVVGLGQEVVTGGIIGLCSGTLRSNNETITLNGGDIPEGLGASIVKGIANAVNYDYADLGSETSEDGLEARAAISNTLKLSLFTTGAKIAIRTNFSSRDSLLESMSGFSSAMENFLDELGGQTVNNDDTFSAMAEVRTKFVQYMLGKGQSLTRLTQYKIPFDTESTLTLAYKRYNNINRADEIFAMNRNAIQHPGFLPSGDEIGILEQ
jgi:prophage DNA circulation protein